MQSREERLAKHRARQRLYRQQHPDYMVQYRARNKARLAASRKAYHEAHAEQSNAKSRQRRGGARHARCHVRASTPGPAHTASTSRH